MLFGIITIVNKSHGGSMNVWLALLATVFIFSAMAAGIVLIMDAIHHREFLGILPGIIFLAFAVMATVAIIQYKEDRYELRKNVCETKGGTLVEGKYCVTGFIK